MQEPVPSTETADQAAPGRLENLTREIDAIAQEAARAVTARLENLTEEDAARVLGVKPGTLRIWRHVDRQRADDPKYRPKSPPWIKHGARGVRYPLELLREWVRRLPTEDGVPVLPDRRRKPTEA